MGHYTYDPGFTCTASCASSITFIDGDEGILTYRGYPVDQLARKSCFLEVTKANTVKQKQYESNESQTSQTKAKQSEARANRVKLKQTESNESKFRFAFLFPY